MLSFTEENYLKALVRLTVFEEGKLEVGVNRLAAYLDVKPATVSDMAKKLRVKELVHYEKYGKIIGVDLVNDGDKAIEPKNSFRIATSFLSNKRGGMYEKNGVKRSTFDLAKDNDLTLARKSVNGGTKDLDKVNTAYGFWKNILKKNNAKVVSGSESDSKSNKRLWLGIGLSVITIGVTGTLIYLYLKKNNKLPNFMKNINIKK